MIPRKHPRFSVNMPAYFARDHRRRADVLNLSLGGCCVHNVASEVGMTGILTLFLILPGHESPLRVDAAHVRWTAGTVFGIRFLFLERREQQRLEQHMTRLASEGEQLTKAVQDPGEDDTIPCGDDFHARVTKKAYALFQRRGHRYGSELEDWLEAERLVKAELPPYIGDTE